MTAKKTLVLLLFAALLLSPATVVSEEKTQVHRGGQEKYERNYVNGKLDGINKEYDHKGRLILDWSYNDGSLDGVSKRYYKSGELMEELSYSNGKKEGESRGYYENGSLRFIETYENGDLIKKIEYDINGEPL